MPLASFRARKGPRRSGQTKRRFYLIKEKGQLGGMRPAGRAERQGRRRIFDEWLTWNEGQARCPAVGKTVKVTIQGTSCTGTVCENPRVRKGASVVSVL